MANAAGVQEAYAGSSSFTVASAKVMINARVLDRTRMQLLNQVRELVITHADVTRGYVKVTAASRINVKSNNPAGYLLAFDVMSGSSTIFDSLNVIVDGREVQLSPGGGWIPSLISAGA